MKHKTPEVKAEFEDSRLAVAAWAIVLFAAGFVEMLFPDWEVVITDVWYPEGAYGSKSPTHCQWRAVDIAIWRRGTEERAPTAVLEVVADAINKVFHLGAGSMQAAVRHDIGEGDHIHCQIDRDLEAEVGAA